MTLSQSLSAVSLCIFGAKMASRSRSRNHLPQYMGGKPRPRKHSGCGGVKKLDHQKKSSLLLIAINPTRRLRGKTSILIVLAQRGRESSTRKAARPSSDRPIRGEASLAQRRTSQICSASPSPPICEASLAQRVLQSAAESALDPEARP